MSNNLGSLTVLLGLNAAEYTKGLTEAEKAGREFGENVGASIRTGFLQAAAFVKTLELGATAVQFFGDQIKQIGDYQDFADRMGDSASAVQSLKLAADLSGTSLEKITSASNRLTTELAKTEGTTHGAGAALKALGLDLGTFKALPAVEQIKTLAQSLSGYEDGASKTVAITALLGKSGAQLAGFLKDLAEAGETQIKLTDEQIAKIDEHSKASARLRSELESLGQKIAVDSVDSMTALTKVARSAIVDFVDLGSGAKDLGQNDGVRRFAEDGGRALARLMDYAKDSTKELRVLGDFAATSLEAIKAYGTLDIEGGRKIGQQFRDRYGLDELGRKVRDSGTEAGRSYVQRFDDQLAGLARARFAGADPRRLDLNKPKLPDIALRAPKSGGADDPTKKLLDNELKTFERAAKQEETLLRDRNRMLDLYYGENLISIEDYYSTRAAVQQEALASQLRAADAEIAALERYKAAATKQKDRAEAQGKINALIDKESELQRAAAQATQEGEIKKAKATQGYADALDQVRASLLDLGGNAGAAAALRAEMQYRELLKRVEVKKDTDAQATIQRLKEQTVVAAEFGAANTRLSTINAQLSMEEERINTLRSVGAVGELSALQQIGDARSRAVALARAEVEAMKAAAALSEDPKVALAADQAAAALKNLEAQTDLVAQKFDGILSDSAASAFADFITGAKTADQAFKAFVNSAIGQLARLAAQDIASSIFKGSDGSSIGGFLSRVLGFGASAAAGAGGGGITGVMGTGAPTWGGVPIGAGRAAGGAVSPFGFTPVGEAGPELYRAANGAQFLIGGRQGGTVVPMKQGGGDSSITVVNQTTGRIDNIVEQRLGNMERVLVLQERQTVKTADVADAGSRFSRTLARTTTAGRRR